MLEQNNEWVIIRRYMILETVATICDTLPMDPAAIAAPKLRSSRSGRAKLHYSVGHYQNCKACWTDDKASNGIMGGGGHCRSWRNGSRRLRVSAADKMLHLRRWPSWGSQNMIWSSTQR